MGWIVVQNAQKTVIIICLEMEIAKNNVILKLVNMKEEIVDRRFVMKVVMLHGKGTEPAIRSVTHLLVITTGATVPLTPTFIARMAANGRS